MNGPGKTQERVDNAADWYNSVQDFDAKLIYYSWLKIRERAVGDSALELGSADGLMTSEIVAHFKRVAIVEGAAKNVAKATKLFPTLKVYRSLFEDFECVERYDNVVAARVLEHLDDPILVLRRIRETLTPNGLLHIIVPNANSFNRRLGRAMGLLQRCDELTQRDICAGHVRVYSRDLLVAHIRAANLEIKEITGTFLKPLSNAQMISWEQSLLDGLFVLSNELPEYCTEIYAVCQKKGEGDCSP